MKVLQTSQAVLLAGLLFLAGCAGSSAPEVAETPAPVETTVEAVTETPTEVPALPPLTEEAKIAAGLAAFEADPGNLIAWDLREATFSANSVNIEVCGWTGETVYDDVYVFSYDVTQDTNGEPVAKRLFDATTTGDCLNTALLDSVYEAANSYNTYWATVLDDPTTFDAARAAEISTPLLAEADAESAASWNGDELHWRDHRFDSNLPDTGLAPTLWRRYDGIDDDSVIELITCTPLGSGYGLYRGDVLVDDFKSAASGTDVIRTHSFIRTAGSWLASGGLSAAWSTCSGSEEAWLTAINEFRPDPVPWRLTDNG